MSVKIGGYELPSYVSYSALTTWLDCGHLYALTRVFKVQEKPSVWLAGGSAVHEVTEALDKAYWEASQ